MNRSFRGCSWALSPRPFSSCSPSPFCSHPGALQGSNVGRANAIPCFSASRELTVSGAGQESTEVLGCRAWRPLPEQIFVGCWEEVAPGRLGSDQVKNQRRLFPDLVPALTGMVL